MISSGFGLTPMPPRLATTARSLWAWPVHLGQQQEKERKPAADPTVAPTDCESCARHDRATQASTAVAGRASQAYGNLQCPRSARRPAVVPGRRVLLEESERYPCSYIAMGGARRQTKLLRYVGHLSGSPDENASNTSSARQVERENLSLSRSGSSERRSASGSLIPESSSLRPVPPEATRMTWSTWAG